MPLAKGVEVFDVGVSQKYQVQILPRKVAFQP